LLIDADKNEFMNVFLSLLRSLFYQLNWFDADLFRPVIKDEWRSESLAK